MGIAREIKFNIDNYVAVQFYPSLKFYFPLFQTHHRSISNPKAKDYRILACKYSHLSSLLASRIIRAKQKIEPAGPSDQCVTLAIWHFRVRVMLWLLTGLVLGHPKFKSSAMLVNSQLVTSRRGRGGGNPVMLYLDYLFLII